MAAITLMLNRDARMFVEGPKMGLEYAYEGVTAGTTLHFAMPAMRYYDHRDQIALPFTFEGKVYWLLTKELGLSADEVDEIERVWSKQYIGMTPQAGQFFKELRERISFTAE